MSGIRLQDVTKRFPNGVAAVDDVSLDIGDGEFMVLVGPSGCGKTTLLRTIAGLEDVTAGTILIGDEDVTVRQPQQRDIAMVFQNYALYPHMTVADNLAYGLKLRKHAEGRARARACATSRQARPRRAARPQAGARCPAASASASRWGGRSCASRRRS